MNRSLQQQIEAAQAELEPQYKMLKQVLGVLKSAGTLLQQEKPEALEMQKLLTKLQQIAPQADHSLVNQILENFTTKTEKALESLAFEFAHDLRASFAQKGVMLAGHPPYLVVELLTLFIDMGNRKTQWLYGKDPLTHPIPFSIHHILKAYDQKRKLIADRKIDTDTFLKELFATWHKLIAQRSRRPTGGRINIMEIYSQLVLSRQSPRFWNAPSRTNFKDYPRELFVRDLVLLRETNMQLTTDGETYQLHLGGATKSQAESSSRSLWLPRVGIDGEYYGDLAFGEPR